ncbi:MAG: peptide ABC transporter substrate-binding protein [Alkaliphilus sp.]
MFRKRWAIVLVLVLTSSLVFVACVDKGTVPDATDTGDKETTAKTDVGTESGGEDEKPTAEGYGILRNATRHPARLINPHDYQNDFERAILQYTQGRLYTFMPSECGDTYRVVDELADGDPVQVDDEGKVWQIKVKKGAKWSNGSALTAEDFLYSWKMVLDPVLLNQRGGEFARRHIIIANAEKYLLQLSEDGAGEVAWEDVGIKKIDDHTLEITTEVEHTTWEVMSHFRAILTAPVYKPLYEELMNEDRTETRYGSCPESIMSSGPFTLDSWVKNSERKYSKNPNFIMADYIWLAGVYTRVIKDSGTHMQLFENGELDNISLSSEDYLRYEEDPRIMYRPSTVVRHIPINTINPDQPILANLNFRKALFFAMDRETIARLGRQVPAHYIISYRKIADLHQGIRFRDMEVAKEYLSPNYGYDPELAVEYFEEALEEVGIEKVSLTLNVYETREDVVKMSEFMQMALPQIFGEDRFELKLQTLPNKQLFATMKNYKNDPRSYDISWTGWSGFEFSPWAGMEVYYGGYGRKNEPFYNEEFDALYNEANFGSSRFDLEERIRLTVEMEKILLRELPFIPMFQPISKRLKSERVILPVNRWVNGAGFGWRYARIKEGYGDM